MSTKEDTVSPKVIMSTTLDTECPKIGKVRIRWRRHYTEEWNQVEFLISEVLIEVLEHIPIKSYEIEVFVPTKAAYERWVDSPLRGWLKKLWKCRKSVR